MNLNTYLDLSGRTASGSYHIHAVPRDFVHAVIGIGTETIEATDANIAQNKPHMLEECGDVMWYVALELRRAGYTSITDLLVAQELNEMRLKYRTLPDGLILWDNVVDAGHLLDLVKKWVYYGRPADQADVLKLLKQIVYRIMVLCEHHDTLIEAICHQNIEKLKARYPGQFSEQLALNRNITGEKAAMEAAQ